MSLERLPVLIDALCVAEKVDQVEECCPPGTIENERRFRSTQNWKYPGSLLSQRCSAKPL